MNLDFNQVPITGGKGYEIIDEETFDFYEKFKDHYSLDDLKVELGRQYTLYRVARRENADVVQFMKLTIQLLEIDRANNVMMFHHKTGIKVMHLGGYKEHWFFVVE